MGGNRAWGKGLGLATRERWGKGLILLEKGIGGRRWLTKVTSRKEHPSLSSIRNAKVQLRPEFGYVRNESTSETNRSKLPKIPLFER